MQTNAFYSFLEKHRFWLFPALFFVVLFLFLGIGNSYRMMWMEQTQLFEFNKYYFGRYTDKAGELVNYTNTFFVQFCYHPWLGAAVITVLCAIFYILFFQILRRLRTSTNSGFETALSFLALALQLPLLCDTEYRLNALIAQIIVASFFIIYLLFKHRNFRFLIGCITIPALYFLCGGGYAIVLICSVLLYEIFYEEKKIRFFFMALYAFLGLIIPFFLLQILYTLPALDAYFYGFTHVIPRVPNAPLGLVLAMFTSPIFYLAAFSLPLIVALSRIQDWILQKINLSSKWLLSIETVIILCFCSVSVYASSNRTEEVFRELLYLINEEKWDLAIEKTNAALELTKDEEGYIPTQITNYSKLALIGGCKLPELYTSYRNYPHFGDLFPGMDHELPINGLMFSEDFFYILGVYPQSRRASEGNMEYFGINARSLKRAVLANLIVKDSVYQPWMAPVFDNTLYYKNFLTEKEKDSAFLAVKRTALFNGFVKSQSCFDVWPALLVDSAPNNRIVFEYALMNALLMGKAHHILPNYENYFAHLGYEHIPTYFEEALLVALNYGNPEGISKDQLHSYRFGGMQIRPATIERCDQFFKASGRFQLGQFPFAKLQDAFGGTYWFHFLYEEMYTYDSEGKLHEKV